MISSLLKLIVLAHLSLVGLAGAIGIRADVDAKSYANAAANRGGYEAGPKAPDFSGTCAFMEETKGKLLPFGSGVLVASNIVLTAAHVVIDMDDLDKMNQEATIHFGVDSAKPSSVHRITSVEIPDIFTDNKRLRRALVGIGFPRPKDDEVASFNDIAIVKIDPPSTNTPIRLATFTPALGTPVWFSGYGLVTSGAGKKRNGGKKVKMPSDLRMAGQNVMDRVLAGWNDGDPAGAMLLCDFDNGEEAFNRLHFKRPARHFAHVRGGESAPDMQALEATCQQGDSGGPMYVRMDGEWMLAGICSHVLQVGGRNQIRAFQYGEIFAYVSVPSHQAWLRKKGLFSE